ncbi:hypothetical protein CYL21_2084 [Plasmodium falciparum NF54]|uniref:Heptatricopeptide repeat-containing protein, putative n=2 Tax=Plasmodium falciparum TaxID=5833 RepID=Q8IL39_PLAF7|nr:heptatricopeptide repeat-containing protein, putative [Plasmodium falciparum 3D7]EWC85453.1 hypothetical protein PFNF54_05749 [Plasmodium falciparum NF54]KAF4328940.1 hypothetical protein CYL21_2084 [Plasmodium falciparum NF54]PKC49967.1 hypothetical protein CK202_0711 [Plasmodium falciparum NF54]CZU00128.1 heptatricopeptide repeat-containing protein, putative [Plasmodium falciparum 3D7]|eukprot:XP_001348584.2 conserved Plasmodium protein, unknown function [Plasmodium falciparum 3D7]
MRKLLSTAIMDLKKIKGNNFESKHCNDNLKSLIIKNIHKFENDEILKIIEKYNEKNYKDTKILKCSYDVFKNNVHRYSFDQINKIIRLYNISEIYDIHFNTSVFNYIIKRLDAIPPYVVVNVFHNLIRSGLRDYNNINLIKEYFIKNIDKFNNLDLTIILSSFTILQEELLKKIPNVNNKDVSFNIYDTKKDHSLCSEALYDYMDIFKIILNKIQKDKNIHENLSVVNSVLILNMLSRINFCNYEIFKFFTKNYYKNLNDKDLEPHHFTLLLNSFAKCNIHINIMKYILKYMNNKNFINNLSYVNITNAVHYMAKFNYRNATFLNHLKDKVIEIIDIIPQREFSNIMWSLAKLHIKDDYFYYIAFQKIKQIIDVMDMMSVAQILDAMRRRKNVSNGQDIGATIKEKKNLENDISCPLRDIKDTTLNGQNIDYKNNIEHNKYHNNEEKVKEKEIITTQTTTQNKDLNNNIQLTYKTPENNIISIEKNINTYNIISDDLEKNILHLLVNKYIKHIQHCSLHVLTQVPFCCLQLNYINSDIYYKSLEILRKKRNDMTTLNLIYAKYFLRIFIEKQEAHFQKLPRSLKQFAKEILNSDNN